MTPLNDALAGQYFQIEEMEDKDSCTTEVLLKADRSVDVLETNGPLYKAAYGSWKLENDSDFEMTLRRKYEGGQELKEPTDVGIFEFETVRIFRGRLNTIGAKMGVEGSIFDEERKVGFFEMIDSKEDSSLTGRAMAIS